MLLYCSLFMVLILTISVRSNSIYNQSEVFKSATDECVDSNHTIKCFISSAVNVNHNLSGNDTFNNMSSDVQQPIRREKKLNDAASLSFTYDMLKKYDLVALTKMAYSIFENYFGSLEIFDLSSTEGRGKRKKQQYGYILLAAAGIYALKVLASYKIIGAISAIALIIGNIALMLSLASYASKVSGGGEKTTLEIVKEPMYYEENVYSKEDYPKGGGKYYEPSYYGYDHKNYAQKNVGYP